MANDTLSMLADAAAGFAKPDLPRVRKLRGSEPGFDRRRWVAMAEQGWFSVLVPEADGGLGLGLDACCVIAEKLGYGLSPEPFVAAGVMAPLALAGSDNAALRESELPAIMAGEKIAAIAWQSPGGSLDFDAGAITARSDGDGFALSGEARFVAPAAADAFIVAGRTGHGLILCWVPRDSDGLAVRNEQCADGSLQGRLIFKAVKTAAQVAGIDKAAGLLRLAVDAGALATAAELCGMMDRMLEMTLEYLRTRQQFGKPIGSFQALQHRAVDLWMQKQLAHAAVSAAAGGFGSDAADARSAAASGAKSRASDAALLIGKQAIQMHGAIGVTDEYDLGLYVNRSLTLSAWLGNGAMHRRRFGELAADTND